MTPQPVVPPTPVLSQETGTENRVFKTFNPSTNYTFPDGKTIPFIHGKLVTKVKAYIAHLEDEIAKGHPSIFIDPNEKTVPDYGDDPIAALRAKIIAEELAKGTIAMAPDRDMGTSTQEKLKMGNSASVGAAMAGSSSSPGSAGPSGAQLMNIQVK